MKNKEKKHLNRFLATSMLLAFSYTNAADNLLGDKTVPLLTKVLGLAGYKLLCDLNTSKEGHSLTPPALGQEVYKGNSFLERSPTPQAIACLYGAAAGILAHSSIYNKPGISVSLEILIGASFFLTACNAAKIVDWTKQNREARYFCADPIAYCTQLYRNFPEIDISQRLGEDELRILMYEMVRRENYQEEEKFSCVRKEIYKYIPEKGIGKLIAEYAYKRPFEDIDHRTLEEFAKIKPPENWKTGEAIPGSNF